jgi:hypothetical protein
METKTHTITGTRKGKEFTKEVEIIYDNGRPKWIKKLFGYTGYIEYENIVDWNDINEYGNPKYLGKSETPLPTVKSCFFILIVEDFKIIK